MDRRSKHLSSEERGVILDEHNRGSSQRSIGSLLGRPASTICRELVRGRQDDGHYCPQGGRLVYNVRRERCRHQRKLAPGNAAYRFVHDHLIYPTSFTLTVPFNLIKYLARHITYSPAASALQNYISPRAAWGSQRQVPAPSPAISQH